MLKGSQEYVLKRKQEKLQGKSVSASTQQNLTSISSAESHKSSSLRVNYPNGQPNRSGGNINKKPTMLINDSASDFLSVTSNFTQQNAELTDELMV